MRLSNTMMINETLLPAGKKAFTLAEVLITLSILGVVAALTIPSLVNRQSDLAAQVKLKKAISNYEDVIGIYMAENEATDAHLMMGSNCGNADQYFKIVNRDGCKFTTADGVAWYFDANTGNATAVDSATAPRYGVALWNANNRVNATGTADGASNVQQSGGRGGIMTSTYTSISVSGRSVTSPTAFMKGGEGYKGCGFNTSTGLCSGTGS